MNSTFIDTLVNKPEAICMLMDEEAVATVAKPTRIHCCHDQNDKKCHSCNKSAVRFFSGVCIKLRNSQSSGFTHLVGITMVIGTLNRGPALGIAVSYPHT